MADTVTISIRLSRDQHTKLVRLAAKLNPPAKATAIVRWLVTTWIASGGKTYAA